MNAEEYKKQTRDWKPEAFNFRGNKANKAFVEEIKTANNFKNEGEALDFIMQSFKVANMGAGTQANPLTATVAELQVKVTETENMLAKEKEAGKISTGLLQVLTEKMEKLNSKLAENKTYTCLEVNRNFQDIKAKLESVLPKIFVKLHPELETVDRVPVTDDELLSIICDYANRDPSKEFPFQELTEPIILKFKAANHEEKKEETTTPAAESATGSEGTDNATGNTTN